MPLVRVLRYAAGLPPPETAITTAMQTYTGDITFTDTVSVVLTAEQLTGPGVWALFEASGGSILGWVAGRVVVTVPSGYTAGATRVNYNRVLVTITQP